jgi:hypothetical protein
MASTPRALSEQLNVTPLKIFGIDMEEHRDADQRWIRLTQTPESASQTPFRDTQGQQYE